MWGKVCFYFILKDQLYPVKDLLLSVACCLRKQTQSNVVDHVCFKIDLKLFSLLKLFTAVLALLVVLPGAFRNILTQTWSEKLKFPHVW